MFKNRPSFRFALVASALIALAAITATATRGTQFAFIDSVQEFFGMASVTTPTRTLAPTVENVEPMAPLAVMASWSFESPNTPPDTTNATAPSVPSPAADGGVLAAGSVFSALHASANSDWTTPSGNGSTDSVSANEWAVNDYFQFRFSTTGYTNLSITWDQTGSNTGPRDFKVQYSTDGTAFTNATGPNSTYSLTNDSWSAGSNNPTSTRTLDLSGVTALNNQATVYIRLVDTSTTAITGGTVATSGSGRIDNFVVNGTAAVTPPTLGTYNPQSITQGGNASYSPGAVPTGTTSITATTSPNFTGTLVANPTTGAVRVTNAGPAGVYTVKVTAFGAGGSTSTTFQLTVTTGPVCGGTTVFTSGANLDVLPASTFAEQPQDGVITDVNNDGKQDLLILDVHSRLFVRLGNGDGTFANTADFLVVDTGGAVGQMSFAVGDINGDGNQDFVATDTSPLPASARLLTFLGNGLGGFTAGTTVNLTGIPYPVKLADLNNDGKLDVVVAKEASPATMQTMLGDGAGGFSGGTTTNVGLAGLATPVDLVLGNFNNDANVDVAVVNQRQSGTDSVAIRLGDGSGGFTSPSTPDITFSDFLFHGANGDFNKDGKTDLAIAVANSNLVSILAGDNTGLFAQTNITGLADAQGVAAGDFNNDGNPDFVISNGAASGNSDVKFGNGLGAFPTGTTIGTNNAWRPVVGDLNGDGRQDVVYVRQGSLTGIAQVRLNNCAQPEMAVAGGAGPTEIPDGGAGGGPNVTDGTEFGSQSVTSGFVDRTYTITNSGGIQLDLTGTPKVVVGGTDPTDFTVTLQPTTPVTASGGTTTFTVRFDPVAGGLRTATLSIANNDADENPYNFSIQGTGTAAPTVTTNAASLVASTSATLNGTANPNGDATTGWFRYATTSPGTCNDSFGTRAPSSGGTALGSGTSAVAYTQGITGLVAGTTYFYCAIAQNNTGTAFGSVQQFTTPSAPTVTTTAASLVTSTTATLNGTGNPNGDATTGYFRYSTTSPVTCNDTFGTRAPATGGTALGSGTSAVAFNQAITGLTGATTYFYCAIAQNSIGTGFGAVLSFSTPDAPTVTTNAATSVTSTSATLNAAANPNSDAATGWFRYSTTDPGTCNDTFGTRAPLSGGSSLGSGTAAVAYSNAISGLLPGNTYFYCGIASNSLGTRFGAVLSFTTLAEAPTVTTNAATLITKISATLNGAANPGGAATTGWFRYSTVSPGTCNDTFGTRAPASGGTSLGSGNSAVAFSQAITGLSPAVTYFYCAIASNTIGTSFGTVMSFSASAAEPDVTTNAATLVTSGSATLNAAANPNGLATTGWFRYSTTNPGTCDDTFGTRAPSSGGTAIAAGTSAVAYSNAISGLLPGTTYFYCGIASNSLGTSFGSVLSFTTLAEAPTVTTSAATLVTQTTATLNGAANPGGDATTGWFRYSTTSPGTCNDTFGTRAPSSGGSALGSGNSVVPYSQGLTGLTASTTYFYCAIAQNTIGTGLGSVMQFTTPAIVETGVTLTGGALVVSDDNGGSSADTITLSCNSSNLRINDPGRVLGAGPGTTQINANTVDVALAGLTSISVNTFDGSDTLNVDLSGCDIIPGADPSGDAASFAVGGINFGGGANTTGPGDKLNIIGGSATTQTFNFTNEHDGNVVLAGGSVAGTITYTGLEPVSSTVTAANVVLNYSAVTETITVTQDAGATAQTKVDSNVGGESVSFVNPTASLEINGGDTGDDTIDVNGFGTSTGGFNAGLTINGGTGNDTVNLNTNITFASGNSLDVDLINDNASPGVDTINVGTSASLQLSGSGTATLNASRNVTTGFSSSVTTTNGNVTITANPAGTTTGAFTGVSISGTVEATGSGKVTVAGKGGDSGASKYGVVVSGGIVRGGTGPGVKTEVTGTGASNNAIGAHGVFVNDFSSITSIGGDVLVTGTGGAGGGGTDNYGVIVFGSNGVITSGGTGAVTVNGFGGSAASKNFGVIPHTGGTITSGGSGAVIVNGTGGPGVFGVGVEVFRNGKITSGGGTVNVTGTSPGSDGVLLTTDVVDALISSGGGAVTVTGVPGPGAVGIILNQSVGGQSRISSGSNANITLIADTMLLDNGNTAVDAGLGAVTLRQFTNAIGIDLGGADSATSLGLTDAELDKVTAATMNIGDANTGDITTLAPITRAAATAVNLTSGASVNVQAGQIDSGGGNVTVSPNATAFLFVGNPGVDATTGAASTFKLASGRTLRLFITTPVVDTGYFQLNVAGKVDITGTSLVFGSGSTATAGASYTIINNDGTADAITGEFNGLPDESILTNFLGSGLNARIDYQGGDGNDCVITMLAPVPTIEFSAPQYFEDESQTAVITITRSGDLTNPSSVSFNTAGGGSAVGGATCAGAVDYVVPGSPLPRTINFGTNVATQTVLIDICGETTSETTDTLNLALSGATNANLGTQTTAVLNINDTASQFLSVIPHQPIDMTLGSPATPYPSQIVVAGAPNIIGGMRVTLYDIWHDNPDNIDVLLVGPQGQKYVLMADVGGPFAIGQGAPVTLTFSDAATAVLDDSAMLATGKFRPTTCETPVLNFFGPAPAGPYVEPGCALARPQSKTLFGTPPTGFGLTNPNGTWRLFVRDDNGALRPVEAAQTTVGSISGGWGLEFLAPTAADVSIGGRVLTGEGRGIRGARVTVTGNSLASPITVTTGVNGRYTVPGLTAGETYVVTVSARRFFFEAPSRVITLNDNVADADFISTPTTTREQ